MATISPPWTKNVSVRTAATLAASGTSTHNINLDNLGADASKILIDINMGSSTTGVTIEIFDDVNDGSTPADVPWHSRTITATSKITILVVDTPYVDIKLTNDDTTNPTGNISIVHAWRQWSSV